MLFRSNTWMLFGCLTSLIMFLNGTSVSANEVRSGFIQEVNEVAVTVNGVDYHFDKDSQSKNDFNRTDLQVGYRITISSSGEKQKKIIWYMASIPKEINIVEIKSLPASQIDALVNRNKKGTYHHKYIIKELQLSGLTLLTKQAAEKLAEYPFDKLILDGLSEISPALAETLGQSRAKELHLNGVKSLDLEAAQLLAKFEGDRIELKNLVNIDYDILTALTEFAAQSDARKEFPLKQQIVITEGLKKFFSNDISDKQKNVDIELLNILIQWKPWPPVLREYLACNHRAEFPPKTLELIAENFSFNKRGLKTPFNSRGIEGLTLELQSMTPEFASLLDDPECDVQLLLKAISPRVAARLPENVCSLVVPEIDLQTAVAITNRELEFFCVCIGRESIGKHASKAIELTPQLCAALSQLPARHLELHCKPFNSEVAHELSKFNGAALHFRLPFDEVLSKDVVRILEFNSKAEILSLENNSNKKLITTKLAMARVLAAQKERDAAKTAEDLKRNQAVFDLSWGFNEEEIRKLYGEKISKTEKNDRVTIIKFGHEILKKPYQVACYLWDDQLVQVYITAIYLRGDYSNRPESWNPYREFCFLQTTLEDKYGDAPTHTGKDWEWRMNKHYERIEYYDDLHGDGDWFNHRPSHRHTFAESVWRKINKEISLNADIIDNDVLLRRQLVICYKELSKRREEFDKLRREKSENEFKARRAAEAKESGL